MTGSVRIARGEQGEAVRDLQRRLSRLGIEVPPREHGVFGDATEAAVRSFQADRGLRIDGICGPETWAGLVESGWSPGDRLLYRRDPMHRGDDVAALQRALNALGFDAGREDGIFGPDTGRALTDFQRNAGLAPDGICGPATLGALDRLSRFEDGSVAAARERELLRSGPRHLSGRKIYLAIEPGLEMLGDVVGQGISGAGAETLVDTAGESDPVLAKEANLYGADLFLGLRFGDTPGCSCDYYASSTFRSERGYAVAAQILEELTSIFSLPLQLPSGRSYAVLRETRMPAVVCQPVEAGDTAGLHRLVERSREVGASIVQGLHRGLAVGAKED